jgi:hypothetical protein
MSEDVVDAPFKAAADQVEQSHQDAVSQLKAKVQKAKADALKKVSS